MALLDSEASFKARCDALGMKTDNYDKLKTNGVNTFSKYAFCCAYSPNQGNDDALFDYLGSLFGSKPTGGEAAIFRRLMFEAHAMSLSDLEANIQRTAESEAKVLPSAERVARLEKQRARLGGLIFNEDTEPSHKLVDKTCQQFENWIIEYIHPGKCASRRMEADSHKLEQTFVIDPSTGNLKGSKKETETMCPINDGLRLHDALQRRALAYDQAGVFTYQKLQLWSQKLLTVLQSDPPAGFAKFTFQQLFEADKFLFGRIAEDTRAKLAPASGAAAKPADARLEHWMVHPEVTMRLIPLPMGKAPNNQRPTIDGEPPAKKQKKKTKKEKKETGANNVQADKETGDKPKFQLPEGCVAKMPDGKPLCFLYSRGVCKRCQPGKRCDKGYHFCWRQGCHGLRPGAQLPQAAVNYRCDQPPSEGANARSTATDLLGSVCWLRKIQCRTSQTGILGSTSGCSFQSSSHAQISFRVGSQ